MKGILVPAREKSLPSDRATVSLIVAVAAYVAAVVLANIITDRLGLVPVGFGLLVTAGTYAAGFALLARDFVHRYGGRAWALGAIALGGILSWTLSSPALAVASTVAFLSAEFVDLTVYEPVRRSKGFVKGALASNIVSAPIDTFVFLSLAGFPLTLESVTGQFVGKVLWATALPLAFYALIRALREWYFSDDRSIGRHSPPTPNGRRVMLRGSTPSTPNVVTARLEANQQSADYDQRSGRANPAPVTDGLS